MLCAQHLKKNLAWTSINSQCYELWPFSTTLSTLLDSLVFLIVEFFQQGKIKETLIWHSIGLGTSSHFWKMKVSQIWMDVGVQLLCRGIHTNLLIQLPSLEIHFQHSPWNISLSLDTISISHLNHHDQGL